jgi:hypothetical protein
LGQKANDFIYMTRITGHALRASRSASGIWTGLMREKRGEVNEAKHRR